MTLMQVCKGCLKANIATYCPACRASLFASTSISPLSGVGLPDRDRRDVLASYNKEKDLRQIRIEYAIQQNGNTLQSTNEKGSHILKAIPTGSYERLKQLPANEHLTMQIAAQVYKIPTAPNGVVFLKNDELAYITRRIDIDSEEKVNLVTLMENTSNYLYNNTVEDIASLLKLYVPAYKPQVEHLFSLSVFNYLFSNHNSLTDSFCLVPTEHGDYILSPAYNLISTPLHNTQSSDVLLFANENTDRPSYTFTDFYALAERVGIVPRRAERILSMFASNQELVESLVSRSFLDEDSTFLYLKIYHEKLRQLTVRQ